eukprot:IDg23748t1
MPHACAMRIRRHDITRIQHFFQHEFCDRSYAVVPRGGLLITVAGSVSALSPRPVMLALLSSRASQRRSVSVFDTNERPRFARYLVNGERRNVAPFPAQVDNLEKQNREPTSCIWFTNFNWRVNLYHMFKRNSKKSHSLHTRVLARVAQRAFLGVPRAGGCMEVEEP